MSVQIVIQQMLVIFILIFLGSFLHRKNMLSLDTSRQLSGLIVNLCNPILLISSAFDGTPKISGEKLVLGLLVSMASYALVLAAGRLLPLLLHTPQKENYAWRLLTIYGNVGFIGIPLAGAVLGSGSLIYVSLNNLIYNILIYTHGISTLKKASGHMGKDRDRVSALRSLVNAGTVSAILTVIFYLCDFSLPVIITESFQYIGRSTTFLSMLVLGVSVTSLSFRDIFARPRLYLFVLLRMLLFPIAALYFLRLFVSDPLILGTAALLLAVPAGNMPLMLARQYDMDASLISEGILFTTLFSVLTIPLTVLFAFF